MSGILAIVAATGLGLAQPAALQTWTNVTGNLAYKVSECGNLMLVSAVPESDRVIVGVAARGLWLNTSTSGTSWSRLSDLESERILNRPSWIVYDPTNPDIFWESGIYNNAGIYHTRDGGKTFRRVGNIEHNDYVSVDFGDPERRTLLAGGHEQPQTVHVSVDGGNTWRNVGRGLPPGSGFSTHPLVLNALTFLVNVQGSPALAGIYRSDDGGVAWIRVSASAPPGPPLLTSSGAVYWAAEGHLVRSTDLGVKWMRLEIPGLRPIRPIELPDGRLVAVGQATLLASADNGATWLPLGGPLPYAPEGLTYSAKRGAVFIWRGDCKEFVPANAVMKLDLAPAR